MSLSLTASNPTPQYDKNGDGVLQIDEFKQLLIDRPETYSYALPEMVQNAFKKAGARK
jgi:hypothetical protein